MLFKLEYKIIRISNYDEGGPRGDQRWILTYPVSKELADQICRLLNLSNSRADVDYFLVVEQDYKLQVFEP